MHAGAVVVEDLAGRHALLGQGLGACVAPLRRVQLALALTHQGLRGGGVAPAHRDLGLGAGDGGDGLAGFGQRLVALRVQDIDLHPRQRLTGLHEIALLDQDVLHPSGELGGDVDLGGLDAAVAADEAGARTGRLKGDPGHSSER